MTIQEDLAMEHFNWFSRAVVKRFGAQMEEHAGPAFMRVLAQFDPNKSEFRAFASRALEFAVKSEYAQDHGRVHSRKRQAELSASDVDTTPIESDEDQGSLLSLLRSIDAAQGSVIAKSTAVCRVLGLFDDGDTAFIIGRRSLRGVVLRSTNS